jgi:hypothetical protein
MSQWSIKLRSSHLVACAAGLIALCSFGCAYRKSAKPAAPGPAYVGDISVINPEAGFVLVDVSPAVSPPFSGTELTTRNSDGAETARLKVTPENKRPFIAADVVQGSPNRGDRVYR